MYRVFSVVLTMVFLFSAAMIGLAQDVDVPLTWSGKGKAKILMDDEMKEASFQAKIHVDADGYVTGKLSNSDSGLKVVRLYYEYKKDGLRKLILILRDESYDDPKLIIMEGRVMKDTFFYGEIFFKPFDKNGKIEKGLDLEYNVAVEIYEKYLPKTLEEAMDACKPVGCFIIEGGYEE